jgi:hypothetical protein
MTTQLIQHVCYNKLKKHMQKHKTLINEDLEALRNLSTEDFFLFLTTKFAHFQCAPITKDFLIGFATKETESAALHVKLETEKCGCCEKRHLWRRVKVIGNTAYVVCPIHHTRNNVQFNVQQKPTLKDLRTAIYHTEFTILSGKDVDKMKKLLGML